jgi:hypothetical protein
VVSSSVKKPPLARQPAAFVGLALLCAAKTAIYGLPGKHRLKRRQGRRIKEPYSVKTERPRQSRRNDNLSTLINYSLLIFGLLPPPNFLTKLPCIQAKIPLFQANMPHIKGGVCAPPLAKLDSLIRAADKAPSTIKTKAAQCWQAFGALAAFMRDIKQRYFLTPPLPYSDYPARPRRQAARLHRICVCYSACYVTDSSAFKTLR